MIADDLFIWDKLELANILADQYSDAEDLLEAMPDISNFESFGECLINDYIEQNWITVLGLFDCDDLLDWLEEKEEEEALENWHESITNEQIEREIEYNEMLETERYLAYMELLESFRPLDHAGLTGYPPKRKES